MIVQYETNKKGGINMNDEINGKEVISGITAMIDTRVARCRAETERNTRWIGRIEKRLNIVLRDDSDELKQVVQTNARNIEELEDSMNAQVAEILSNLNGQHVNTDVEDRLTAIEGRLDDLITALTNLDIA